MANSWLFPLNLITSKIERQGQTELREIRIVLPVWLEERKAELFDQLLMGQLSRRWRNRCARHWESNRNRCGNPMEIGGWCRDLSPWTLAAASLPALSSTTSLLPPSGPSRRSRISNFALPPRQSMDEMWMICLLAFWLPIVRISEAATAAALSQAPKNGWKKCATRKSDIFFFIFFFFVWDCLENCWGRDQARKKFVVKLWKNLRKTVTTANE